MADLETPLLAAEKGSKGFVEGCPGCKSQILVREKHGFPKKLLVVVANMMLCNSLPIAVIFPFLYFMVQDFHVTKSDSDIGYYAGWIGSSFMAGRAVTAVLWGTIADKYGRKPVILCGILSIVIFNTLFGLSTTFWMALTTRFLLGSFNGLLGTLTAYATEICSKEYISFSISLVGTMWGLGIIIGPALGGYLSQPALKYPAIFAGTIFDRFPYFLQALVISAYAVLVLMSLTQLPVRNSSSEVRNSSTDFFAFWLKETLHKHNVVTEGKVTVEIPKASLLRNRPLLSAILVYCFWAFHDIAYSEVVRPCSIPFFFKVVRITLQTFSLWAVSPTLAGGLGWTSTDVGELLAISGVFLLVFQLVIFPQLANLLGPIYLYRLTSALTVPLMVLYPTLPKLPQSWLRGAVIFVSVAKSCIAGAAGTSSFLLVNNSVVKAQRGAANGLSLSIVSVSRALGPAVGGAIFAWSQTRLDASIFPGDQLLFFFLGATACIASLASFSPILSSSTNKPVLEDELS